MAPAATAVTAAPFGKLGLKRRDWPRTTGPQSGTVNTFEARGGAVDGLQSRQICHAGPSAVSTTTPYKPPDNFPNENLPPVLAVVWATS